MLKKVFIPVLLVLICAVIGITLWGQHGTNQEPIKIYKAVEVQQPTTPKPPPPGETAESGHWHGDVWHAEPHETHAPADASQKPAEPAALKPPPGAVTTPDFPPIDPSEDPVEAAYKRLEYIKNNPYAWGGVHSERTTELIAELMPPPVLRDEGHGEEVTARMNELIAQSDPRAAEVIITTICEGNMSGKIMTDALVAIGPPAVPYILPYLEEGVEQGGRIRLAVFRSLGRIGAENRGDLGGIVEHILIPKFTEIAADSDFQRFGSGTVIDAREALERLR